MRGLTRLAGLALTLLLSSAPALALDFDYGDLSLTWNNRLSTGVALRMQDRNQNLIGKQNIPGQQNLCSADSCISLDNDPSLNQRLVDAAGGFAAVNGDDGDLNYDKYDPVSATTKLWSDLRGKFGDHLAGRVRILGFYDPVNVDFEETHTDTRYQDAHSTRSKEIERKFAKGVNLLDAYLQYSWEWGGRNSAIAVGNQTVRWGESTLLAVNSLSEINPPNQAVLRMPGSEISEIFQPVPLLLFTTDLWDKVSAEFVYQLKWKEVTPDPRGSFFADNDLIGPPGTPAYITLGQFGEDPFRRSGSDWGSPLDALTSTTNTVYLGLEEPRDDGQYGVRLNYYADWLNGGTETSFYFLNYHSRLPYATVYATDDSCTRDQTNFLTSYLACNGYNGNLPHVLGPGKEPLPIDTLRANLGYPEDIQMYGVSFNTNVGSFSVAGEYSFRPNLPMQVNITDVLFAGLQPAFPAQGFAIDPTGLATVVQGVAGALGLSTAQLAAQFPGLLGDVLTLAQSQFPGAQDAVPSYLANYRGYGRINAHQRIEGYERMKVGQFDVTVIKAFSENIFGADQIIQIAEVGGTQVFGMPDLDQLQFEGAGLYRTHYSPGADGTGTPDGVAPYPTTLNPTRQTTGFATPFSWGLRTITRMEYNDVVFGWNFMPQIQVAWDIEGIAPAPFGSFVEGRKEITAGTDINFSQAFSARMLYQWFTGGGLDNTRKDRDNLAISLTYNF